MGLCSIAFTFPFAPRVLFSSTSFDVFYASTYSSTPISSTSNDITPSVTSPSAALPRHLMTICHQDNTCWSLVHADGIVQYSLSRSLLSELSTSADELTYHTQVVRDLEWKQAITTEFNVLLKNNTWVLFHPLQINTLLVARGFLNSNAKLMIQSSITKFF